MAQSTGQPIVAGSVDECESSNALFRMWTHNIGKWSHLGLDNQGKWMLTDLIIVAFCYQHTTGRRYAEPPTAEESRQLQGDMRKCTLEWHQSAEKNLHWVRRLESMTTRFAASVVFGLSHFELPEDLMGEPDSTSALGTGMRYADIDMHGKFDNRIREIEEKTRTQTTESKEDEKASAGTGGGRIESALVPHRFVAIGGRSILLARLQLSLFGRRTLLPEWDRGCGRVHARAMDMAEYSVTSAMSKRIVKLFQLRCLPLGAGVAALRFSHGRWDAIGTQVLLKEELGSKVSRSITEEAQNPIHIVFSAEYLKGRATNPDIGPVDLASGTTVKGFKWTPLRDTWLLEMMSRLFRTDFGISFLDEYVIQRHDFARHHTRVAHANCRKWGRVRRPILVEAMGRWFVEGRWPRTPEQGFLQPCPSLIHALAAWCAHMLSHPWEGKDIRGRDFSPLLETLVDPSDTLWVRELMDMHAPAAEVPEHSAESESVTSSTPLSL